jgi:hypothetical protein
VGGVGLGGEGVAAALGVETPDERGVGLPGLRGCALFDAMAVPEASGAAEGGEAGFGGDAGAGEDEETVLRSEVHRFFRLLFSVWVEKRISLLHIPGGMFRSQ